MPDRHTLALLGVTAGWGSTFVVVKDAVEQMPVTDFLTWRFAIAALIMLALRPRTIAALGARGRQVGVVLGLALGSLAHRRKSLIGPIVMHGAAGQREGGSGGGEGGARD